MWGTLFIIGNGFDLYHGLPTRYIDFIEFMQREYAEEYGWLYDSIKRYSLTYWDFIGKGQDNIIWSDMENVLGSFEPLELVEEHRDWNSPPLYNETASVEIQQLLNFGFHVDDYLHDWISDINKNIKDNQRKEWISRLFREENLILSFNYTLTIEKLYEKEVLHIHGKKKEKLIMGHGNYNGGDVLGDDFGINLVNQKYVRKYFRNTYKNCRKIIKNNSDFFSEDTLGEVQKIFVLGHSLNYIDIPYIDEILKLTRKSAKWIIVCYDESSKKQYKQIAEEIFGNDREYEVIFWESIEEQKEF